VLAQGLVLFSDGNQEEALFVMVRRDITTYSDVMHWQTTLAAVSVMHHLRGCYTHRAYKPKHLFCCCTASQYAALKGPRSTRRHSQCQPALQP
jgi:hypothetical protein